MDANTSDTAGPSDGDHGAPGRWRDLVDPGHLGIVMVLCGGVALYATSVFLTTSLLPSATREIGGAHLYAWVTTVFLLGSVLTSVLVSRVLATIGAGGSYLIALGAFTAGSAVCGLAGSMPALLGGRFVQGLGGGLMAGLGYALIRSTLPERLWTHGSALISAMWGVGTFIGPVLGGALAEFTGWRLAFAVLAVSAIALAALAVRALSGTHASQTPDRFPAMSLTLVVAASVAVSVAGILASPAVTLAGVLVGLLLLATLWVYEARRKGVVLPASAFAKGSRLPWIYLSIAVLAIASTAETFVPLFGQDLAGLGPLLAGFLGAAIAAGWTLGEIPSAGASTTFTTRLLVASSPVLVAASLATMALTQKEDIDTVTLLLWVVTLVAIGVGIGIAWPHLAAGAMRAGTTSDDGDKASAAINTVQLVANAFGAALSGVLVNFGATPLESARYLYAGFALVVAVIGVPAAIRSRPPR